MFVKNSLSHMNVQLESSPTLWVKQPMHFGK